MKIAIIGKFGPEEFGRHIYDTLIEMGYDTHCIEYGPKLNQTKNNKYFSKVSNLKIHLFNLRLRLNLKQRRQALSYLFKSIKKINNIDLIISTHDYFISDDIENLHKLGVKNVVLWFPDSIANFKNAYFLSANYDFMFFKCEYIVDKLQKEYLLPAYYLAEAFNPKAHHVHLNEADIFENDISIIGNLHSVRYPIIKKLIELDKYKISIYGTNPPFYLPVSDKMRSSITGKYAINEEKALIIKKSKINLNTLQIGEVMSCNVRTFELCGAGGFQIMTHNSSVQKHFEINKEIITYDSFEDLIEKIDYYLEHEELRKQIASAGYFRAQQEHTYEKRLLKMLNIIENRG